MLHTRGLIDAALTFARSTFRLATHGWAIHLARLSINGPFFGAFAAMLALAEGDDCLAVAQRPPSRN